MRTRIIPTRGVVIAQKPPKNLGITPEVALPITTDSWTGTRSFVFFPEASARNFCYLTQQPAPSDTASSDHGSLDQLNEYPPPFGELMLGGTLSGNDLRELGVSDDRRWNPETKDYLSRAISKFFVAEDADGDQSYMLAHWSGIMGASVDSIPWVGRIPERISGRVVPHKNINNLGDYSLAEVHEALDSEETITGKSHKASARLAAPGEWMAAGYSGEGMVHAWMSAKALAYMVLGLDKDDMKGPDEMDKSDDSLREWFPDVFRLTEERWKNAGVEDLIGKAIC
jgi:FAD dependent oxidoreductase